MNAVPEPHQSDVERAFLDAMAAAGFLPGHIEANTPHFVRFDAPGDKVGRQNGFYKLKLGKYPTGWFGDWKNGEQHQWHFDDGRTLTAKERADIKAEQRRLKAEAAVAREAKQREIAENASLIWGKASTDCTGHPYLARKGIEIPRGLRIHAASDGTQLLAVPMWSFDHAAAPQLTNIQMIDPTGSKRFLKAGRVERTFFSLKGDTSIIIICEGVATGFSIWKATGASVVCAFNANNLVDVAKEFALHRPLAKLMIAGDNDVIQPADWEERNGDKPWKNIGAIKAEVAAKAIGCRWVLPVFEGGPDRKRTDFNDLHLLEGERMVAGQIMGAWRSVEAEDTAPGAKLVEVDFVQDETWRCRLPKTNGGHVDGANVQGVAVYIENHRLLRDRLAYNGFTQAVELDGNEMADHHVAEFRRVMHADLFKAKKGDVADEMLAAARKNTHDPLTDYLTSLKWDGKARIDTWLTDYAGVDDTEFARVAGRKFLIGAVARALRPGCKMDTMLVLEGDQGVGKSTLFRYLFGDRFFVDYLPDFHSKDSFMQLQGAWCVEVAELAALSKADVADVKQFLSRLVDKFRPPFGKLTISVPRRVVFGGSVNPEDGVGYLRDPTGARRFWPVAVRQVNLDGILRDRNQLWAEAVDAFQQNELWYLTMDEDIANARDEQDARREVDSWEAVLRDHVLHNSCNSLTIEQVLADVIKVPLERHDARLRRRVGAVLRSMGWESKPGRPGPGMSTVKVFRPPGWTETKPLL